MSTGEGGNSTQSLLDILVGSRESSSSATAPANIDPLLQRTQDSLEFGSDTEREDLALQYTVNLREVGSLRTERMQWQAQRADLERRLAEMQEVWEAQRARDL